ncbi:hypothetical protein O6H91_15G071800 [Diphasiastrum complanatum]|uniref:Uncharacterized protein n=2 Tax=Diphasiastrum complanatum TaxID=34168 RepID=A0ACC2BJI7_DIPCM|nr:hypothetical protein O6H91_Y141300 [Diphasiastrum complanatum]KAJ7529937.1 hypothetical protein O6H91_15G071800 [Diphasiastrum complanatum]KAJ7529938.1 hypothetical protein O6H91_15G071800 [Diphasiastrum complanatum]
MEDARRSGLHWVVMALGACLLSYLASSEGSFIGINVHSHLPSHVDPKHVVDLVKKLGVGHVRLHDANSSILSAFAYSDVEILVGITNNLIPTVASSQAVASAWLKDHVFVHLPYVKITGIVVGNEVLSKFSSAGAILLPAMRNVYNALAVANMDKQIKVSTSLSSSLLSTGFLPSQARFNSTYSALIEPLLNFLSESESYFMLSIKPLALYLQYKHNTSLDYALFLPNQGVFDTNTNLPYKNLFDAAVDATYNAMAAMNHPELPVVVSEIYWPTLGTSPEEGSPENAALFNKNLVRHILSNNGTPQRPGAEIQTYMFDPFSELKIIGVTSEHQWSIFEHNTQKPFNHRALLGFYTRDTVNGSSQSWCVAKGGIPDSQLGTALNWACGQGSADCGAIQSDGSCFNPDTYSSHASYAFNSYYQKSGQTAGSCDFGGSAMTVTVDPSYASCSFAPSGGSSNQTFNPNGSNNSSFGVPLRASSLLVAALASLPILAFLR